jgi:uncharacterized protein (UPF0332 family)
MSAVADHLSQVAKSRKADEADAFGRAAFNRYYYAVFLSSRDLLMQVERSWSQTPHKNIPDLLEEALVNRVRDSLKKDKKHYGLVKEGRAKSLLNQAIAATGEIAGILRTAYDVRITADYKPEEKVIFEPPTFRLATHTEAEAKQWLTRIDRNKGIILSVAKEIALV